MSIALYLHTEVSIDVDFVLYESGSDDKLPHVDRKEGEMMRDHTGCSYSENIDEVSIIWVG